MAMKNIFIPIGDFSIMAISNVNHLYVICRLELARPIFICDCDRLQTALFRKNNFQGVLLRSAFYFVFFLSGLKIS